MNNTIRIAQTDLTCGLCKKKIPAGHPYAWKQIKKLDTTLLLARICVKCLEGIADENA